MFIKLNQQADATGKPGWALDYSTMHAGQVQAWQSDKRVVLVLAGARAGKSSFGPLWLHREMLRKGPGDYLVAGPTYPLLDKAAAPEIDAFFGRLLRYGQLRTSPLRFVFSDAGARALWPGLAIDQQPRIIFGHADDPDSLEAMTVKAAWLDEAGQRAFRGGSYEAVQRRLAIDRGRCLITTTPYANVGWLKAKLYDPWEASGRNHPDMDVVNFDSTANPAFPPEEFERARASMPLWRFNMAFRGLFERPAGLIYDCFERTRHVTPRRLLPPSWVRYTGVDFGSTNTAAVFLVEEQNDARQVTGRYIVYREYHPGKVPPQTHVVNLLKGEPRHPTFVGGNPNEKDWRTRFSDAGVGMLEPPVREIEVGIDAVHTMIAEGRLLVMDDMIDLLDEIENYSRVLDENGEPTDKIDSPSHYHLLDALRYVCAWLERGGKPWDTGGKDDERGLVASAPPGVFVTETGVGSYRHGDSQPSTEQWEEDLEDLDLIDWGEV